MSGLRFITDFNFQVDSILSMEITLKDNYLLKLKVQIQSKHEFLGYGARLLRTPSNWKEFVEYLDNDVPSSHSFDSKFKPN